MQTRGRQNIDSSSLVWFDARIDGFYFLLAVDHSIHTESKEMDVSHFHFFVFRI